MSRRTKAWAILGYVAFEALFMGIAYWQHWELMTSGGPRTPFGIIVAAALYWTPVTVALVLRETPTRKGGPGTMLVDRPRRGASASDEDGRTARRARPPAAIGGVIPASTLASLVVQDVGRGADRTVR